MIRLQLSDRAGERRVLWLLLGFTLVAVIGYGVFALHPERLVTPSAARFYGISFQFFARIHILLAALALGWVLVGRLGARWLPAFALVVLVSFLSEHIGTGYGIPFGAYHYTGLLGTRVGPRVPALIPVSWFLMALPSWVVPQPIPGMPWVNLLGWYVTGLVIMGILDAVGARLGLDSLPVRWMLVYYGLVLLMPLGMVAAAGLWPAVATTLAGVGLCVFLARRGLSSAPDAGIPVSDGEKTPSAVLVGVP